MSAQPEQRCASQQASLLVETTEAHDILLGLLPASALGALACTCRALRHAASSTPVAASRWRTLVEQEIGVTAAALHEDLLLSQEAPPPDSAEGGSPAPIDPHAKSAAFWRGLCRSATKCDELHWSSLGAARLWDNLKKEPRPAQEEAAQQEQHAEPGPQAQGGAGRPRRVRQQQLARSGHSATLLDEAGLIVVVGGLMDDSDDEEEDAGGAGDGGASSAGRTDSGEPGMSVLIIRSPSMEITLPTVEGPGECPPNRYRHAAERVPLNVLGPREAALLCKPGEDPAQELAGGNVIAVHGGYQGRSVYNKLLLLWISSCGSRVRWAEAQCGGTPPPACFHHAMLGLKRSPVLLVVGGETASSYLPAGVVYSLWLPTMTWEKKLTISVDGIQAQDDGGEDDADAFEPSSLWLHMAALRPCQGTDSPEEVLVFGGIEPVGLASMAPVVLNTESWVWRRAPAPPAKAQDPWNGPAGPLSPPPRRHRTAAVLVGKHLVLHGGCPARGSWLRDTWVLDTATLLWHQGPADVQGRPKRHAAIAGHSLQGMVAFGGCTRGIFGISPVAKMDVLLLGPRGHQPSRQAAAEGEASGSGSRRRRRRKRRHQMGPLAGLEVLGQVTLQGQQMQVLRHPRHGGIAVPALLYEAMLQQQDADADAAGLASSGSEDEDEDEDEGISDSEDSEAGSDGEQEARTGLRWSELDDIDVDSDEQDDDNDDEENESDCEGMDDNEEDDKAETRAESRQGDQADAPACDGISRDKANDLNSFPVSVNEAGSSSDEDV